MSLKDQKREEKIKASQAEGARQKAANVAAAGEQKRRALESGGRYQEGGSIVQVNVQQGSTPKNIQGGRDYSVNLSETLSFRDATQTKVIRQERSSSRSPVQTSYREEPKEPKPKQIGQNKSVELSESLNFATGRPQQQGATSFYGGQFIAGAEVTAKLRQDTEEQRRQRPLLIQAAQGAAEGIGGLGSSIAGFGISVGLDVKGLFEGKKYGEGSKEFRTFLEAEQRPSTISQAISQLNPDPMKREEIKFDVTSISRAAGEALPLVFGGRTVIQKPSGLKPSAPSTSNVRVSKSGNQPRQVSRNIFREDKAQTNPFQQETIRLGSGQGRQLGGSSTPQPTTKRPPPPSKPDFKSTRIGLGSGSVKPVSSLTKTSQGQLLENLQTQKTVQKGRADYIKMGQGQGILSTKIKLGEGKGQLISKQKPVTKQTAEPPKQTQKTKQLYTTEVQRYVYPPGTKQTQQYDSITLKVLPAQQAGLKFKDSVLVTKQPIQQVGLTFKDEVTVTTKPKQKEGLIFRDIVIYKKDTRLKQPQGLIFTDELSSSLKRPPPEEPPLPPRPPIFGFQPGPLSSRDYDAPSPPLGNTKDWRGNVPEFDIVGIYGKRQETTYTIGKVPGLKKSERKRVQRPIRGFGTSLNITNKGSVFKKGSKVKIF